MNVVEFGTALIQSGDLDPIYLMLNSSQANRAQKARFCLAYWMFYHAGVAAKIAEPTKPEDFWHLVWRAQGEKWPRGTERRHFKGEQSRKAITELEVKYPRPEDAIAFLAGVEAQGARGPWDECDLQQTRFGGALPTARQFADVAARAQSWRGFGPWIAFKVCDMLDAVLGVPVKFGDTVDVFFDDPIKGGVWVYAQELDGSNDKDDVEGLKAYWENHTPPERKVLAQAAMEWLLLKKLRHLRAPHAKRPIRIQEVETILCKYKSHLNGHYPIGKDTEEILHRLVEPHPNVRDKEGWGPFAAHLEESLAKAIGADKA